jgi:hypothetical protein
VLFLQRKALRAVRQAASALEADRGHTVMGGPFWRHAEKDSKAAEGRAAQAGLSHLADDTAVMASGAAAGITSTRLRLESLLNSVAGMSPELRAYEQEAKEAAASAQAQRSSTATEDLHRTG